MQHNIKAIVSDLFYLRGRLAWNISRKVSKVNATVAEYYSSPETARECINVFFGNTGRPHLMRGPHALK
jgi:hypothetical protein